MQPCCLWWFRRLLKPILLASWWGWVIFSPGNSWGAPRKLKPVPSFSSPKSKPAIIVSAECRWATSPIVLDGKADEAAWESAQVITKFGRPWERNDSGLRGKTHAKLLWDSDALYFFAEMQDADLFADLNTHDGMLWMNDTFELFLRPDAEKSGYFEFEVNAANAVLDGFFPKRELETALEQIKRGEFRVESAVDLRGTLNHREDSDQGWSVEGRIPWVDFLRTGGRPEPGEIWQFNLCRYNHDQKKKVEISCTAPIRQIRIPAFVHQIENYSGLKFVGPVKGTEHLHGLPQRIPLTTSTVIGSPDVPLFRTKRLYPQYSPKNPILAKPIPGTDQLLVITENMDWGQSVVWRVKDDPAVTLAEAVKLLETPDRGLAYDACFHPRFAENRYLYFGWAGDFKGQRKNKMCRITRYTMTSGESLEIDPQSASTIIEWESDGHNGLALCFGSDGMMYVTSGDGSTDSDMDEMGQNTDTLLSKVLRIDVDHPPAGKPYAVPGDNPYVNDSRFAPETWTYGLRNPWRITADSKTGQIWVGNNGQDLWEQAYLLRKGANYGWSVHEGGHAFLSQRAAGPHPFVPPTVEHPHSEFRSLTGGIVYYGEQFPELRGMYLYGDYATGRIWGVKHNGTKIVEHQELASSRLQITNFAQNHQGELLLCDHAPKGGLYTLERVPHENLANHFPKKLSESGLFDSVSEHRMKPGIVPYSINAPFWSDGMYKERYIALPEKETIQVTNSRGWNFPNRTVLIKSFAIEREPGRPASRQWIETRFLTRQEGEWSGYTYRWNAEGTDADLVAAAGQDEKISVPVLPTGGVRQQVWRYPSRAECLTCHTRAANFVLGICSVQMNKVHDYGTCQENQLSALQYAGLIQGVDWAGPARQQLAERAASLKLTGEELTAYLQVNGQQADQRQPPPATVFPFSADHLPRLVNPYDAGENLQRRAKSWLHANCSSCHVAAGGGNSQMELEFGTAPADMRIIDVKPRHAAFGLTDARLIAPGDPQRSVLLKRISTRGPGQMPQLATDIIDEAGVALIRQWIESLK